jgi:predicted DNA-binding transcriptional regulator AlpA
MGENSTSIDKEGDEKNTGLQSDWLTRRQASRYLQVGISTLDSRMQIKKYKLGGKSVRYLKKDLDEYLLAHCVEPNKKGKEG